MFCSVWKCDQPAVDRRLEEPDGTGRRVWRHYCRAHFDEAEMPELPTQEWIAGLRQTDDDEEVT